MTQDSLNNKVVLVTGASRGFGRALALEFSAAGAHVLAVGRDRDALKETVALASERTSTSGVSIEPVVLNVCDEPAVTRFIDSLDTLDILINNAGIARISPLLETPTETLREILEVNVVAAFVVMREAARKMVEHGGGHIINIASDAAIRGIGSMTHYVASKHALLGMGRSAALELRQQGVRVTTFNPGPIATHILGEVSFSESNMAPDDLARLVVHLAQTPPRLDIQEVLVTPGL